MSDQLQSIGGTTWIRSDGIKMASHYRGADSRPAGGNFLFEDGHVKWYKFDPKNLRGAVDIGSLSGQWILFYKPYDVSTNLVN
jgi:hypothetical protein